MSSTFSGLTIAKTGLFVSQRALHVVSHNIANANTEGFSRQRLDVRQYKPEVLPGMYGTLGRGVDANSVIQIREEFYDKKVRMETTKKGEWDFRQTGLEHIENIFNEPTDTGIRKIVDNFFEALQELSKNPDNLTTRALVRQRAIAYTESVNTMSNQLKSLQKQMDFQVRSVVSQINSYAEQIRDLNKSIYMTELDNSTSNDLRDQRNLLLDKLSKLTNIDYFEDGKRHFHVLISGKPLVSHYNFDTIEISDREVLKHEGDVDRMADLSWSSGGKFRVYSGELRGLIDMRDNIAGDKKGIPYYIDRLDHYTDRMSSEVNRLHTRGFDLAGNPGTLFFTKNGMHADEYINFLKTKGLNGGAPMDMTGQVLEGTNPKLSNRDNDKIIGTNIRKIIDNNPDYANKSIKYLPDGKYYLVDRIPANELSISRDLDLDLNKFAASETLQGIPGDGKNALAMLESRYNPSTFAWGSSDDFVKSLVSNLGVDAQEALRMSKNQKKLIVEVENKRQSIMGVSFDEEVSEMIKFQHAYNANARMLTTMDEILDVLINRLGLVGR